MSTHICPKCKNDSFTWVVDEEISSLTIWGCYNCRYEAIEDESLERICSRCGSKSESYLKDQESEYWWCSNCNRITNEKN